MQDDKKFIAGFQEAQLEHGLGSSTSAILNRTEIKPDLYEFVDGVFAYVDLTLGWQNTKQARRAYALGLVNLKG